MARLTLTAATDMLVSNGGKGSQAVRMWAKQWSFTDSSSRDGCAGCTVSDLYLTQCIAELSERSICVLRS